MSLELLAQLVSLFGGGGGLIWGITRIYAVRRLAKRDENVERIKAQKEITLARINRAAAPNNMNA